MSRDLFDRIDARTPGDDAHDTRAPPTEGERSGNDGDRRIRRSGSGSGSSDRPGWQLSQSNADFSGRLGGVVGGELHPDASYVGGVGFAVPGDRDLAGFGPPFSV